MRIIEIIYNFRYHSDGSYKLNYLLSKQKLSLDSQENKNVSDGDNGDDDDDDNDKDHQGGQQLKWALENKSVLFNLTIQRTGQTILEKKTWWILFKKVANKYLGSNLLIYLNYVCITYNIFYNIKYKKR